AFSTLAGRRLPPSRRRAWGGRPARTTLGLKLSPRRLRLEPGLSIPHFSVVQGIRRCGYSALTRSRYGLTRSRAVGRKSRAAPGAALTRPRPPAIRTGGLSPP